MKLILAVSAVLLVATAVNAQKACTMGAVNKCGKGMVCVSPHHDPFFGTKGTCVKECTSGTEGACPVGSSCWISPDAEPGSKGGCVKESQCFPEHHVVDELESFIAHGIVMMYEHVLDKWYKHLFHQVLGGYIPTECAGPEHLKCGKDHFCLLPPHSIDPNDVGHCFDGHPEWVDGDCVSGTENPCAEGMICMTPPESEPGAEGECVPIGSKACVAGTGKGCAKGHFCHPLDPGHPAGYCKKEMPCDAPKIHFQNLQYWQFYKLCTDFIYSEPEIKKLVREEIKKIED
jgi:hypothetical protein